MIKNVRHTGIVVNDLQKQIVFYSTLGFVEVSRDVEEGTFIEQVTGISGVKLEWIKMKSPDGFILELLQYLTYSLKFNNENASSNQLGCSHIAFTVSEIEVACEYIRQSGGSIVNKPALAPNGNVKVAYCHDPEGVLMEIVEEL